VDARVAEVREVALQRRLRRLELGAGRRDARGRDLRRGLGDVDRVAADGMGRDQVAVARELLLRLRTLAS
jgi:hypothetical protein